MMTPRRTHVVNPDEEVTWISSWIHTR